MNDKSWLLVFAFIFSPTCLKAKFEKKKLYLFKQILS